MILAKQTKKDLARIIEYAVGVGWGRGEKGRDEKREGWKTQII